MMNKQHIRPIRSERDYNRALTRVEELMDMECSLEEGEELDVLATLVEVYEEKHFPIDPPDPVEAIKFRMEQMGQTQSDLAPIFGSSAKVSEVLSGKRDLTLKMIRALHKHLGIPADILIRDGSLPEPPTGVDLDRFPITEMARCGLIEKMPNIKDRIEEFVHELIAGAGGPKALPSALFRQGARVNAQANVHALQAWCLHILSKARQAGLEGMYQTKTINPDFLREVAQLSSSDKGPKLAREFLAEHGIALVVAQHLSGTYLDGAALWTTEGVPVVGMTIRHDRIDNFWFCLLHELAHFGRHFPDGSNEVFLDDLKLRERNHERDDQREREADEWAQEALIPPDLWNEYHGCKRWCVGDVISLAQKSRVHPAVVAGRIRHETGNYRLLTQLVGRNQVRQLLMEEPV